MQFRSLVAVLAAAAIAQAGSQPEEGNKDGGFEVVIVYAKPEGGCNTPATACQNIADLTNPNAGLPEIAAADASASDDPPTPTITYAAPTATMKPAVHWDVDIKPATNVKPVPPADGNKLYYGVSNPKEAGNFAFLTYYFNQPSVNLDQCGQVSKVDYNEKDLVVTFGSEEAYEIAVDTWSADDEMVLITFTEGCGDFDKEDRCYFKVSGLTHDDETRTIVASGAPSHPDDLISMGESVWGYWTPDNDESPVSPPGTPFSWGSAAPTPTPTPRDLHQRSACVAPRDDKNNLLTACHGDGFDAQLDALLNTEPLSEEQRAFLDALDAPHAVSHLVNRGRFGGWIKDTFHGVKDTFHDVKDAVKGGLDDAKDAIKDGLGEAKDKIKDGLGDAKETIKDGLNDAKDKIGEKGDEIIDKAKERLDEAKKIAQEKEAELERKAQEKIREAIERIKKAKEAVSQALTVSASGSDEFSYKVPDEERDKLLLKVLLSKSPWGRALKLYTYDGREETIAPGGKGNKAGKKGDAKKEKQTDPNRPQELDRFIKFYCVDCSVSGTTKVGGSIRWTPFGGLQEGKLEMWNDMQLKLFLGIDAQYALTKEIPYDLIAIGLPGLSYGVVTIGPYISMGAKVTLQAAANGRLLAGAEMKLNKAHVSIDLMDNNKVQADNWKPEVKPKVEVEGELKLSAALGLPVGIRCGIKFAKWELSAGIVNEPSINAIAQVAASIGNINGTGRWDAGIKEKNGCNGIATQLSWRNSLYIDLPKRDPIRLLDTGLHPLAQECVDLPHRRPIRRSVQHRVAETTTARILSPEHDGPQQSTKQLPLASYQDANGRRFSSVNALADEGLITACPNGNIRIFPSAESSMAGCSATWASVDGNLIRDGLDRVPFYYNETMSQLGVSRLRLHSQEKLPRTAMVVAFVPGRSDRRRKTNHAYLAVDSSSGVYHPVACDYKDGSATKAFLVADLDQGLETLRSVDVRHTVTGGEVDYCYPLQLQQSSVQTQGYSSYAQR